MTARVFITGTLFLFALASQPLAFSQTAPQGGTLTINGHAGQVPVLQLNGKSSVDVEALARLDDPLRVESHPPARLG